MTDLTVLPRIRPTEELRQTLEDIVFTSARNWHRSIRIDRYVRDILVGGLSRGKMTERITGAMVDAAAKAINECMENDGWLPWGVPKPTLDKHVRTAALESVRAALTAATIKGTDEHG